MKIIDKFKSSKQKVSSANSEIENDAKKNSDTAISYARSFQKKLNYSKKSIDDLEEILDYYSNDALKSNPTEDQIWSMSIIFGSYLGEVMLKNGLSKKGYHWGKDNDSNIPLLVTNNGDYTTPIDKVYKRLVNGKEDNVRSFYDVIMKEA